MYGTVARMVVKPANREKMRAVMEGDTRKVAGAIGTYTLMENDSDNVWLFAIFEDKATYDRERGRPGDERDVRPVSGAPRARPRVARRGDRARRREPWDGPRPRRGLPAPAGATVGSRSGSDPEATYMADALQNYIDGKWVDALDGERFDVFDPRPARSSRPRRTQSRTTSSAPSAPPAARSTTARGGPGTSARERGRILLRAADIVRRDRDRLAAMESLDAGKPIWSPAPTSTRSRSCSSTTADGPRRSPVRASTSTPTRCS